MVSFANPVAGVIHPKGWVRPVGNTDFVVVRTCADHGATNQGCALDLGNGRCDGPVLASKAGTVKYRDDVQGIIRIAHLDGSRSDYAHMRSIRVGIGQQVAQGQQIGVASDAHDPSILNFSGCHLHFAIRLSWDGPEIDAWPYMNQHGGDMKPIPPSKFTPLVNKQTKVTLAGGATLRADRFNNATPLKLYGAGTAFTPLCSASDGDSSGGSTLWYGGLGGTDAGVQFGWLQASALAPLSDTTPDTTAAFNAGVDAAAAEAVKARK